jgi:hypothetical protein
VWWGVLVSLWFAAVPLLTHSQALAINPATGGIEICTSHGSQFIAPDGALATESPNGQDSGSSHQHCPFCLHPADRYAPPPHSDPYLFVVQGGQQVPVAWQAFFYLDKTPLWAPSRGPPVAFEI